MNSEKQQLDENLKIGQVLDLQTKLIDCRRELIKLKTELYEKDEKIYNDKLDFELKLKKTDLLYRGKDRYYASIDEQLEKNNKQFIVYQTKIDKLEKDLEFALQEKKSYEEVYQKAQSQMLEYIALYERCKYDLEKAEKLIQNYWKPKVDYYTKILSDNNINYTEFELV